MTDCHDAIYRIVSYRQAHTTPSRTVHTEQDSQDHGPQLTGADRYM